MPSEPVAVEIVGDLERRQVEHVGNDLVPGDTDYFLVLKFPNEKKHLVKVSREAFESYLEAKGADLEWNRGDGPVLAATFEHGYLTPRQ